MTNRQEGTVNDAARGGIAPHGVNGDPHHRA